MATLDSTGGAAYAKFMWNATGKFTTSLMKNASWQVASLIYTTWKDAGSPQMTTGVKEALIPATKNLSISAYPNPFNGQVTFSFTAPKQSLTGTASLVIFNITGKEIDRVSDINLQDRSSIRYSANKLASGTYFASLQSGKNILSTVKFILMK
jgi:hypothetical protein